MHSALALLTSALLASAAVHDIKVGDTGFDFNPQAISAAVGDQVVFHFTAKNHSATQSSFASPCGPKPGGFDSGFNPVAAGSTDFPTFTITVNDTNPVWVYCKQAANTAASHCGMGMVFSVNCPSDDSPNSFTNFKNSALAIGQQLQAAAASSTASASPSDASAASSSGGYGGSPSGSSSSSSSSSAPDSAPGSANAATSAVGTGAVHVVTVGANALLAFDPPHLTAAAGDVISFQFMSKNHSATQSTFATPCKKLLNTTTNVQGFDSGFVPIANGSAPISWNVTVNDTTPIWVYCRQTTPADHCGTGMVFAVNSDESSGSTKTFATFQAAAKAQNGTATTSGAGSTPTSGSTRFHLSVGAGVLGAVSWALLQ